MTNARPAAVPAVILAPTDLLTVPEVAQRLRVDPVTIRRWLTARELRGVKVGRHWRIERAELDHVLTHGVRRTAVA